MTFRDQALAIFPDATFPEPDVAISGEFIVRYYDSPGFDPFVRIEVETNIHGGGNTVQAAAKDLRTYLTATKNTANRLLRKLP